MKTIKIIIILFVILSSIDITAQSQYPSPELVDTLLKELDSCKKNLKTYEEAITYADANPDEYTLAEYRRYKRMAVELELCIQSLRDRLDKLRKDHPDWFNNPSAVANGKKKGDHITPKQVEIDYDALYKKIHVAIKRFGQLEEPEH